MLHRPRDRRAVAVPAASLLVLALTQFVPASPPPDAEDRLKAIQESYVENKTEVASRAYHFGSQGPGAAFSNHTSHTNRMVPVYTFGSKADLRSITGRNSPYRDPERVRALYGQLPENTVNPRARYGDQSELYKVQMDAAEKGAKHLFIVWFDGMDWETTRAAAIAKTGSDYEKGEGSGLIFQDYDADGTAQYGFVVTSPTNTGPADDECDLDKQTLADFSGRMGGGYDASIAGRNPWTRGPRWADGYLKGQSANKADREGVEEVGGVLHAYTDSSCSAAEFACGVKSYNGGVNVSDDGRFLPTVFNQLQEQGWKVGTVTSVPFDHASPASMYAHNVSRDDYQDLGREMLGLESIAQQTGKFRALPGFDVVIGTGWGMKTPAPDRLRASQGLNGVPGNLYIAEPDLKAIDVANGGRYVVSQRESGVEGTAALLDAAERAAKEGHRLFGFYGTASGHLPYRTADGRFDPAKGIKGVAERYEPADLNENPSLADMTRAALKVLSADEEKPFALFVEVGDTDWALHDNNLDNAVGTIYDGEEAIQQILDWVETNSNWDESVLIVTSDHGHYLVLDDPAAIAGAAQPAAVEAAAASD